MLHGGKGGGEKLEAVVLPMGSVCSKCGARRIDKQIGIEDSPTQYIDALVAVFEQVRRVLKPDGTCWINIGDSYARTGGAKTHNEECISSKTGSARLKNRGVPPDGLKGKDLIGLPWMLAFALRDAGWYLRQDIIWHKNNPLPESVTDRCTKSHEYIFLLSKSGKYYFDSKAIAEEAAYSGKTVHLGQKSLSKGQAAAMHREASGNGLKDSMVVAELKNRRDVWTMSSSGIRDEHFAPYPEEIPKTCILAGSREGDTVLDPFTGSGTTGFVALRLGRKFVGVELNPAFVKIVERRFVRAIPSLAWENY
jgi:DNA modification methylase